MTASNSVLLSGLLVAGLALTTGCGPGEDPGPGDGLTHATWEEDSDDDNNFPTDAEPVSVGWTGSVTIEGSMSDCGWDPDEDWPWTGDEDNYEVEVPADGFLDVRLTWDHASDLDLLVWFEPPTGMTITPDDEVTINDDDGEIEYLFDQEYEAGDDVVLGVLCATGPGGDYDLVVSWED